MPGSQFSGNRPEQNPGLLCRPRGWLYSYHSKQTHERRIISRQARLPVNGVRFNQPGMWCGRTPDWPRSLADLSLAVSGIGNGMNMATIPIWQAGTNIKENWSSLSLSRLALGLPSPI